MKNKWKLFIYLRRVEWALDCPRARRRALMEQVRRDAGPLLRERPEEEPAGCLGNPNELARGLLKTLDPKELVAYRRGRTLLRRRVLACLAAALIGVSAWAIYLYRTPREIIVTESITIYAGSDSP